MPTPTAEPSMDSHLLASQGLAQQTYYYLLPLPTDRKIVRSTGKDSRCT